MNGRKPYQYILIHFQLQRWATEIPVFIMILTVLYCHTLPLSDGLLLSAKYMQWYSYMPLYITLLYYQCYPTPPPPDVVV